MFKFDTEKLMDVVTEENDNYFEYRRKAAEPYDCTRTTYKEYQKGINEKYDYFKRAECATQAIIDVLKFDNEQTKRLYIAARAVRRWNVRTNYEFLIPDGMKKQIERFLFGEPFPELRPAPAVWRYEGRR